jgi:Protein of unknown function (DUF3617)
MLRPSTPAQEAIVQRIPALLFLLLTCAMPPARAAELPSRKPGLWDLKMSIEGRSTPPQMVRQCVDAATDPMMQSSAGPYSVAVCPKRDVQQSANSTTIDSTCTIAGKPATAHATITGSFDSAYTMTVTSKSEALPGTNMTITINGRWLGPCTADEKPGDIIFSDGRKVNILEATKSVPSPGTQPR